MAVNYVSVGRDGMARQVRHQVLGLATLAALALVRVESLSSSESSAWQPERLSSVWSVQCGAAPRLGCGGGGGFCSILLTSALSGACDTHRWW